MKIKTIYITTDNERFDNEIQAEKHQQDIIGAQLDSLLAFLGVRDTLKPRQRTFAQEQIALAPSRAIEQLGSLSLSIEALEHDEIEEDC